jgi:zinc protease
MILRAAALVCALAFAAQPAFAQPRAESAAARFAVPIQEVVSPGGIEAWLVSDSTVPIIALRAYWHGGSATEPEALIGATGVMADMLTEGAGDLDANAFKERLEELNGSVSFSSSWDGVGMGLVTLSQNRDAMFDMARLAMTAPRFDDAPLARIKRQIAVGIRQRETNPNYISSLALDAALYPDHPYARQASMETVEPIDRAVLAARHAALLTRAQLDITVVGDISAEELGALLDSTFGVLPAGAAPEIAPQAELGPPQALIVRALPQPQSLIRFAAPGIQDEDPDWTALAVANYILGGGGFSSRLMEEVREQRGLVYGVGTGPSVLEGLALMRGSAQTENAKVVEAIEIIRAELRRFHDEGATQAEIDDAITYLTGSFALSLDSNQNIAGVLHSYQTSGRDPDYVNARNDRIRAVTREDVARVARRLFNPDDYTFVVVGQPDGLEPTPTD